MATLQVTQRRSSNGSNKRQLDTLRSLGLRRIGHTVQVKDCEQARGMVHAVRHLVEVHDDRQGQSDPGKAGEELMSPAAKSVATKPAEQVKDEQEQRVGLHSLKPAPGSRRPRKRVGRGEGSGTGKTRVGARRAMARAREQRVARASRVGRCRFTCACASFVGRT